MDSISLIVVGIVMLVAGIILGHFFPNRYWIALIAIGIVLMIVGVILLAMASFAILPVVMTVAPTAFVA